VKIEGRAGAAAMPLPDPVCNDGAEASLALTQGLLRMVTALDRERRRLGPAAGTAGKPEDLAQLLALAQENVRLQARQQCQIDALDRLNATHQTVYRQLQDAQTQLLQSEKMASIGQLAAGVAHEINNPIGYVFSNLGSLERYLEDLLRLVAWYVLQEGAIAPEARAELKLLKEGIDLEFLRDDVRTLLSETREGVVRVRRIVQDLKDFSRAGSADEWQWVDLRTGLESTLNMAHNELKYKATVVRDFAMLPEIHCLPSQLNQVFLNLLVNAAQAIEGFGTITVRTGSSADELWVEVEDTGKGIAPEHLGRIFDPFFTTKPVGHGTGLGLSLSYGIVQKHGGRIDVASAPGQGSRFRVVLPIGPSAAAAPQALAAAARPPHAVPVATAQPDALP
jgi:signal transduction histidine kinase